MMTRSAAGPDPAEIYLDHAATTPVAPEAVAALGRGVALHGNPSSRHSAGQAAREAVDGARAAVARLLGCAHDGVVFTGGGSEAINLALLGTFAAAEWRGHLVTTRIEHAAVLGAAGAAATHGVAVTVVPPDPSGHVDPERIAEAIRPDTLLVSVMHANNETGAIQPVERITEIAHAAGALVHVDAVQTAGKLPIAPLRADLVSVSAHKFGGVKGVGALRVPAGHELTALIHGGGQESGYRAGTENVPGILAMAAAAEVAVTASADPVVRAHREHLRARLLAGLAELDGIRVHVDSRVMAETVSVAFPGVRGDTLADLLDLRGVHVSTGSACHAGSESPSHVLTAMGVPADLARSTARFSFGSTTTEQAVVAAAEVTVDSVRGLRRSWGATPAAVAVGAG
ncbi:cysteine desulfurase [Actinokineospora globicatena]|nr:cysteine desulfurase [Actinokineospora globicatena]GLW79518.1 putative aminotransferase/cysteine desulfhydrase [Actinokineospora globicatena]GLW86072.1 putative aminotransferase/cysteine desulfhydrase [Actinokineospora globicatena]